MPKNGKIQFSDDSDAMYRVVGCLTSIRLTLVVSTYCCYSYRDD